MSLYLKIDQDENAEFFQKFDHLSPLRQKIWGYIKWFAAAHSVAKPSQSYIANKCNCSRSAVSEAFAIFKSYGWLSLTSRGWKRSKIIGISASLRQMDLINRSYFSSMRATYRATHSYSSSNNHTGRAGEVPIRPIEIPELAIKLGFSHASGLKLALLPEYILQETLYQCKKLGKQGFRPKSEEKYFVGTAISMANKKGIKIDWRTYYKTINMAQ